MPCFLVMTMIGMLYVAFVYVYLPVVGMPL